MNASMRILLADDHTLVRAGIRALLSGIDGTEVVAEAADGMQTLQLTEQFTPDVVLLDISMGAMSGLHALEEIHRRHPEVKCIILSMHAEGEYVTQALRAGAAGYLLKDAAPAELEIALQAVRHNETYLSPAVSRLVVDGWMRPLDGTTPQALTARQQDILRRIAQGQSTKEIAWQLDLSVKTVEAHRAQIMERLGIRDVPGLTRYAIRKGLVSADH